ncbi:MAG: hypothetical protein M1821_006412 [Bathelium mastoideum]|nr:MAG: hypothetical protein M1821_006412 [Bathelium mastoideum]
MARVKSPVANTPAAPVSSTSLNWKHSAAFVARCLLLVSSHAVFLHDERLCASASRSGVSKGCFSAKVTSRVDACCQEKPLEGDLLVCADACRDGKESSSTACADACCSDKNRVTHKLNEIKPDVARPVDPEMGRSGKEHVILSVSGMTCTGCETKLARTLAALPAITELRTSLILARAEFDLDTGAQSMVDVLKHLERTTEFKCERVRNEGSNLYLICQSDASHIAKGDWPKGVTEIRVVDKKTIRVDFDPEVTGARDLVEKGWPGEYMLLASPRTDPILEAGAKHVRHVGYMTLLSTVLTIPVLVLAWAPLPDKKRKEIALGAISLAFATIIQFAVARPFYSTALKALIFSRVIEMDLLIVLSTSTAYIFSVIAFGYLVAHKPLPGGEFFETSTLLVTLIMLGRYIAALARQKAVESISIRSLQAPTAIIVNKDGVEKGIDARLLQYGDVFKVSPDSRVPTDGTVISGSSEMDESMLTGESRPVEKSKGSSVIAGSINGSGVLSVRLSRIPGHNTISTIAGMVDEAKLSKPKIQELADQVATYFVPVVVSITIVVFAIWIAIGKAVQHKSGSEAVIQAVTYAIAVLIVSCPCAIGLAVPVVIVVATGIAAERGVVFKSSHAIEVAYKTDHVVFDKTGTLTQGRLTITKEEYPIPSSSMKALLLGLTEDSKHPVSVAVATHLKVNGVTPAIVSDAKNIVGKGVEGASGGRSLRAGNSRWLGLSEDPRVAPMLSQGYTVFCFTVDGSVAAIYGLEDSLRGDSLSTVAKLQDNGISVHVLSGDDDGAVRAITSTLKIPDTNVRSRCSPAEKQAYIKEILATPKIGKSKGRVKTPVVIFCGDGTNDAVALTHATIGVHMNEGTEVAKSAADVVLMRPSLSGILIAIAISRKSIHRMAFNFGWSFVYNVFAILLAAGAFVHARIQPEFAGLEISRPLSIRPKQLRMAKRQAEELLEETSNVSSPASKKARVESLAQEPIPSSVNGKLETNGHTTLENDAETPDITSAAVENHVELEEAGVHEDQEPDDGDAPVIAGPIRQDAPAEGYTDLYLDTIDRSLLDFDFEKLCSVTLSNINVYACLVCGKYYQGRGPKSQAYFHALEIGHHVYINMETKKVYVLPEGYEVKSKSLDDIKYVVDPSFGKEDVTKLDREEKTAWDLGGKKYMPGFVGMNNIKANDYFNVVIHALAHVPPLRNFFMLEDLSKSPQLAQRFSILVRKIWNPRAFKAHVSPHELLQEVALRSSKRFTLTEQSDPVDFLSWFLNHLHLSLGGSKTKPGSSIVQRVFQGQMQVESQRITARADAGDRLRFEDAAAVDTTISRFLILTLDLPAAPLFQDELDKNIIPQVPLTTILAKYDGLRAQERLNTRLRYRLLHPLPPFLCLHIKRFSANKFVHERNPTIVTFPVRSLDLNPYVQPDPAVHPPGEPIWYDLVANITHEAVRGSKDEGVEGEKERKVWRVQVQERARDEWVEVQDLYVQGAEAQTLFTKESYCQIWERRREGKGKGKGKAKA